VLPATDLYLMGRTDVRTVRRGIAPVKRLLAAGVTVAAATNNVRNAFTPLGTAGLPLMGYLLGVRGRPGGSGDLGSRARRRRGGGPRPVPLGGQGRASQHRAREVAGEVLARALTPAPGNTTVP
jgi:hypothetical protein